jgi:hypothetical protein
MVSQRARVDTLVPPNLQTIQEDAEVAIRQEQLQSNKDALTYRWTAFEFERA